MLTVLLNLRPESIHPALPCPRCTRLSALAQLYAVQIPYSRVNKHFHSFILFISKVWNTFLLSALPPNYFFFFLRGEYHDSFLFRDDPFVLSSRSVQLTGATLNDLYFFVFLIVLQLLLYCKKSLCIKYLEGAAKPIVQIRVLVLL